MDKAEAWLYKTLRYRFSDADLLRQALAGGALAAEGQSIIHGVHHVRRGYETLEGKLLDLGAGIEREPAE